MAEPVMKPLTAGAGMNSTIQPSRRSPMPRTMKPCVDGWESDTGSEDQRLTEMKATVVAI